MSQDILIKNIPLSYLKTRDSRFFNSKEFSNFESLFDKYKSKVDLSSEEVEDYEILPLTELKSLLLNKYLSIEYLIETEEQQNDLIFIQLSGKKENSLNFEQKRFITDSMSDLQYTEPFFVSVFLNNIFLNTFNKGLKEAKKTSSESTINQLLVKPKLSLNVSKDVANVSNFFDRIKDPLVYNNIEYDSLLKYNNIKNNISINPISIPTRIFKRKIETLQTYNVSNLKERSKNLKYKLFMKYYDHRYKFPETAAITIEDNSPALDILTSLIANENRQYILAVHRTIVLDVSKVIINHGLTHEFFKIRIFDKVTGIRLENDEIIERIIFDSDTKSSEIIFTRKINAEILLISDNYEPERISNLSLFDYYSLSNFHENIEVYTSILENQKIVLDINNYNQGYALIEIIDSVSKEIILPKSVKFTDNTIELYFDNTIGRQEVIIYILPTFKVISNISKVRITCNNIYNFLKSQDPFNKSLKAWREFSND